ncbi:MAG: ribonuclease P protein component [Lentimicrobiaceae bacterium]|nr:ribonuclease P protein component [Lentimicrobiaceae bacterium]
MSEINTDNSFSKNERICSALQISELFSKGKCITKKPIKLIYLQKPSVDNDATVKVLISVPKKKLHKAVDRNRVKRLIRECYRLNKSKLHQKIDCNCQVLLAFIYTENQVYKYAAIYDAINDLFNRLPIKHEESNI